MYKKGMECSANYGKMSIVAVLPLPLSQPLRLHKKFPRLKAVVKDGTEGVYLDSYPACGSRDNSL